MKLSKQNFYYASKILEQIWNNQISSRMGAVDLLGIDKSTVTNITNHLIEHDVLLLADEGTQVVSSELENKRGRKRKSLLINPKLGAAIGIEIQPEFFAVTAVDPAGEVLFSRVYNTAIHCANLVDKLTGLISDLSVSEGFQQHQILGIGIGITGIVDPYCGRILWSAPLQISQPIDLVGKIQSDIPVFIDNDANSAACGPLVFNRGSALDNYLMLIMEFEEQKPEQPQFDRIATGLGLVLQGNILYGPDFTAGEFRSALSSSADRGQFSMQHREMVRIKNDAALRGRFFNELAVNIGFLVNILNLRQVFMGGGIERYRDEILPVLNQQINQKWLYSSEPSTIDIAAKSKCEILFFNPGDRPASFGAACMVLKKLFTALQSPDDTNVILQRMLSASQ